MKDNYYQFARLVNSEVVYATAWPEYGWRWVFFFAGFLWRRRKKNAPCTCAPCMPETLVGIAWESRTPPPKKKKNEAASTKLTKTWPMHDFKERTQYHPKNRHSALFIETAPYQPRADPSLGTSLGLLIYPLQIPPQKQSNAASRNIC